MKFSGKRLDPIIRIKKAERVKKQKKLAGAKQEANHGAAAVDDLAEQIERLAGQMKSRTRGAQLKLESLKQLDELMELLRRQRHELSAQADDANQVLEDCQDELLRADQSVRTLERLKEIREKELRERDRHRQARGGRAA